MNLVLPHARERWMMECFSLGHYSMHELIGPKQVQLHQQVLFLSDTLCAAGNHRRNTSNHNAHDKWSILLFLTENPSPGDFHLWHVAIQKVALGAEFWFSHKIWPQYYVKEETTLIHLTGSLMDIYPWSQFPRHTGPNRYTLLGWSASNGRRTDLFSQTSLAWGTANCLGSYPGAFPSSLNIIFRGFKLWGHTWIWNHVQLTVGMDCLANLIR
ncbi:LOW QUALITY PROTEIN: hypothetical protein ACHAW6_013964 [Cyclotella cf. meneghiniana]